MRVMRLSWYFQSCSAPISRVVAPFVDAATGKVVNGVEGIRRVALAGQTHPLLLLFRCRCVIQGCMAPLVVELDQTDRGSQIVSATPESLPDSCSILRICDIAPSRGAFSQLLANEMWSSRAHSAGRDEARTVLGASESRAQESAKSFARH
jgi:hypothetical protein